MRTVTRRGALTLAALAMTGACGRPSPVSNDRLVTVDATTARLAAILGHRVEGTGVSFGVDPILAALTAVQNAPVRSVSAEGGELDPEALAAVAPGLIVGTRRPGLDDTALRRLATVELVDTTGELVADTIALGRALGAEERARTALDRLADTESALRDRLGASPPTVSVLSASGGDGTITAFSPRSAGIGVLRSSGIEQPAAQAALTVDGPPFLTVSAEQLTEHDADVLVVLVRAGTDSSTLRSQPLYSSLRAAREGLVVEVDALEWAGFSSLVGARWALDDLAGVLSGAPAPVRGIDSPDGIARLRRYRDELGAL